MTVSRRMAMVGGAAAMVGLTTLASAQTGPGSPGPAVRDQRFPDIIGVQVKPRGADTFDFDVTVSSPYDTPQRYADAFRVLGPDGKALGERILLHDHQHEQPFTRDLHGVKIPAGVARVVFEGRDQRHGWGGKTFTVSLPGR